MQRKQFLTKGFALILYETILYNKMEVYHEQNIN